MCIIEIDLFPNSLYGVYPICSSSVSNLPQIESFNQTEPQTRSTHLIHSSIEIVPNLHQSKPCDLHSTMRTLNIETLFFNTICSTKIQTQSVQIVPESFPTPQTLIFYCSRLTSNPKSQLFTPDLRFM